MTDDPQDQDPKDFHLRHQVVETGFSAADDVAYDAAMAAIRDELGRGRPFSWLERKLKVPGVEPEILAIALNDFLKIAIAERHFQGKEPLKALTGDLHATLKRLQKAREEMLKEVEKATVKAYHLTQTDSPGG
ncbi:MAG: hypothetical protein HQL82_08530 [Magnetococcales bacterium]|nr:hypothetical protein [Magnetococcales bacterium]